MIEATNLGAGIAGSIINPILQHNQNIRNRKYALQDRDYMNEYNSPKAQMARLKEAGLNPNLVYGSGNAVTQSASSNSQAQAPQVDTKPVQQALYQWQDYAMKEAKINQLEKYIELQQAQKKLVQENTRTAYQRTEAMALKFSLDNDLYWTNKEFAEERLREQRLKNTGQGYRNQLALQEWEIKDIMKQPNLDRVLADIGLINARIAKTPYEVEQLKASTRNLTSSAEYRDLTRDQLQMVRHDLHRLLLNNIGVAEGRKTLQESQTDLNQIRANLKRGGLSESFISDLFKLIPQK
jgi:hypothetical protein